MHFQGAFCFRLTSTPAGNLNDRTRPLSQISFDNLGWPAEQAFLFWSQTSGGFAARRKGLCVTKPR